MDLNILSAETYYDGALNEANPQSEHQGGSDQANVGLPPNATQSGKLKQKEAPAKADARQPAKRENSKKNVDESNGARQRGRPRLDARDQSAAERRRTQIRLAQRAYRQRKETTISALNKRVAALENTIEKMNRTFLDFNDKAIASRIGDWEPSLAGDLKHTVGRFIDYARSVAPESEAEDREPTPVDSARVHEPKDIRSDSRVSSPSKAKLAERSQSLSPRIDMDEIVTASALGYETTYRMDDEIDVVNSQSPGFNSIQDVQVSSLDNVTWAPVEPIPSYGEGFPEPISNLPSVVPPLNKSLPPPSNFSYQETSFARRLLRSTLQNAIRLLTDPNASREQVLRFFRFTFTWTTRTRCLAKLRELISGTSHENLEIWTAPQWHVGNSGLHYPRVGLDVGSPPPPNWAARAPMGPRRPGPVETPLASSLKPEAVFEITGLGGTWLDSNDVDQYLQNRGIFLDGHSNWAEVDLTVEPTLEPNLTVGSPTESSRNSSGGPQSPQNADLAYPDGSVTQPTEYFWDGNNSLGMPNFPNTDMDLFFDEQSAFDPKSFNPPGLVPTNSYTHTATRPTASKTLYLDVEKFVKTIIGGSVCIGRSPGFRQSTIDNAISSATRYRF